MDNSENTDFYIRMKCTVLSMARRWEIILMCMLVCAVGADIVKTVSYHPEYATTVTATVETESNMYEDLEGSRDYITTMDYILNGQVVKDFVAEELGQESAQYRCEVSKDSMTNIIKLRILSPSQRESYLSLKYIVEWYTQNTEKYNFEYSLNLLENPVIGEVPVVTNQHSRNFMYGLLAGGILSAGLIGLIELFKKNIKTPNDITRYVNCRLYAKLPKEKKEAGEKSILISSFKTSFAYKEAIKKLRRKLEQSSKHHGYKVYMLTSALENEGKTSVATNLAIALAKSKYKVLLVDCDIRKPAVHKIFNLSNENSINDYLRGRGEWTDGIHYLDRYQMSVATARMDVKNAERYFARGRWKSFILRAKKVYDFVILDTAPAYYLNDTLRINEYADASLLVIRQNEAQCNMINETIDRLENVNENVIGCIYNASVQNIEEITTHAYGDYGEYGE